VQKFSPFLGSSGAPDPKGHLRRFDGLPGFGLAAVWHRAQLLAVGRVDHFDNAFVGRIAPAPVDEALGAKQLLIMQNTVHKNS